MVRTICIKTLSKEKVDFLIENLEKIPINIYISYYRFKTFDNVIIHYPSKENINQFYEIIAIVIKKCIEKFYEEEFIKKNVYDNYFYLSSLEREYICEITKKVLELPDEKIGNKNKILIQIIYDYIKNNNRIVLEGVVNFRIKEYKDILDKIIEVSVFSYLDLTCF